MKYEKELRKVMEMFGLSKIDAAYFDYVEMVEHSVQDWEAFNEMMDNLTEEELYETFDKEYAKHHGTGDLFDLSKTL